MSHLLFFRTGCCTYIVNVGNRFRPRRVRGQKYISDCKCASCAPEAHKECAQQAVKSWRKSPKGFFDKLEYPTDDSVGYLYFL